MFRRDFNCSRDVASILTKLCTLKGEVPQGAPMSMDIANLVCCHFDKRLEGLASKYNLKYTRYCDDMIFSGDVIPNSFISTAKNIISQTRFALNPEKEHLCGRHEAQIVTGLTINSRKPCVPKRIRRTWRKEKYLFEKYGLKNLPEELVQKKYQQIKGKIAYINYIGKHC